MPRATPGLRDGASSTSLSGDFEFITTVLLPMKFFSSRSRAGIFRICLQQFIQSADSCLNMLPLQNVGRQKAKDRFAGSINDDATLHHLSGNALGEFGGVQLQSKHESYSTDISNAVMLFLERFKFAPEESAHFLNVPKNV